jgi:hypothetical protein
VEAPLLQTESILKTLIVGLRIGIFRRQQQSALNQTFKTVKAPEKVLCL